jgi:hypothetical protein
MIAPIRLVRVRKVAALAAVAAQVVHHVGRAAPGRRRVDQVPTSAGGEGHAGAAVVAGDDARGPVARQQQAPADQVAVPLTTPVLVLIGLAVRSPVQPAGL